MFNINDKTPYAAVLEQERLRPLEGELVGRQMRLLHQHHEEIGVVGVVLEE